ncbi:DUF885 domain-containing protein [Gallaecimonas sp. GXIMD4217]|uniref:DUF885 domain-containing protein n=1 Tax=Gallaecimonas sp. GXIMD4217 TaxID=3131927 RepID=UPI00311ABEF7
MKRVAYLLAAVVLSGCGGEPEPKAKPAGLNELVEGYFDQSLALQPMTATLVGESRFNHVFGNGYSEAALETAEAMDKAALEGLSTVDRDSLSGSDKLSYDMFLWELKLAEQGRQFPFYMLPVNQFGSDLMTFFQLGSGSSAQPFDSLEDYERFALRAEGLPAWIDTAIMRMRQGMEDEVTLPRVLVERVIEQLRPHLVSTPEQSLLWSPVASLPLGLGESRSGIEGRYSKLIMGTVVPALTRFSHFLDKEYLPSARASSGLWDLPNGKAWYRHQIKVHTTTQMTADQIHRLGLKEVARIHDEMRQIQQQLGIKGGLRDFLNHMATEPGYFFAEPEQLVAGYEALKGDINALLPAYFDLMPRADYEVREVEAYRAKSAAGASYEPPAIDGSRPGIFYINTYNLKAQPKWGMTTLSLHEAAPGHHFQIALQQELEGLPRFRRFNYSTAFVEGWALYAEYLGIEMGLFADPLQHFGKLSDELLRAMRLVVDTGLHAKGWSREQAIAYMLESSAMAESDVRAEVERYMALPGQALAYKVGQLKILALRQHAQEALGDKFDIRQFHRQVLGQGAMPLALLEQRIDEWIQSRPG